MYDAFVAFCEDDIDFVKEKLIKELEEKYNLKLCFNLRNLMPGAALERTTAKIIAQRLSSNNCICLLNF